MHRLPRRSAADWRALAYEAIPRLVEQRGGAVVWPEVEGLLAHRDGWIGQYAPDLRPARRIDPHHLGRARQQLVETGVLQPVRANLSGREVTAYLDAAAAGERRRTAVERVGATKRRLYRSFLGWTSDARLCGRVAERSVAATLDDLAGRAVWLDPQRGSGEVRKVAGEPVPGGPLDHAGLVAVDAADPRAGFVPFLVEVKNVRQTLYPPHREIWDLLWKAGHFADHVPVLIAPRVHHTTFVLFGAIGALAFLTTRQSFAPSPAIEERRFRSVTRGVGISHATQLQHPDRPSRPLEDFFTSTLHRGTRRDPDHSLLETSRRLWARAAPICARPEFRRLRDQLAGAERSALYQQLLEELHQEDLAVEDLMPRHLVETDEEEPDEEELDEVDFE